MGNWRGHLRTITAHKLRVMKCCFRVGLYRQGLLHDLSKYGPTEFRIGARYYQGDRSPNEIERLETGRSTAWLHHKGRNKHHLEYWIDYSPTGDHRMCGMEMPVNYVVEMFCDRIAACQIYQGGEVHRRLPLGVLRPVPGPLPDPPQHRRPAGEAAPHAAGRGGGADPGLHPPGVGGPGRGLVLTMGPSVG